MNKYDLYWVEFVFEDQPNKSKKRPCLLLSDNLVITIAKVTGHSPRTKYDVELLGWKEEGLSKPSTVRLNKRIKISTKELQEYIGHLTQQDIQRVEQVLNSKNQLNNSLDEDTRRYPIIDISHIHSSELKKLVRTNFKGTKEQRDDFNFATSIDNKATVVNETDKAVLVQLFYYRWNNDRTDKIKKSIFTWLPKNLFLRPLKNGNDKSIKETIKSDCRANLRGLRESSESGSEYFTKEEIKTLPNELSKYFQEQRIPKYYDISVEDMGDKKYLLRGNIDYGELNHDHKYFDNKVKEFFNDKGIQVDIYEPDNLKGTIDEDGIYSSSHIIQKQGNMVYTPQDNKLDNFIDNDERE